MPVYEFLCNSCLRKVDLLAKSVSSSSLFSCPYCGGQSLTRLVSSFAYHKSLSTIWEESPDEKSPDYYKDPRNIGRWTEKKMKKLGVEMPSSVSQTIQAAREGELPSPVKELNPNVKEI